MQPLSGNQRPDLLTSLMNMSFALRLPQKMHLCRSSSNVPRLPWFLEMLLTFWSLLTRCTIPRLPRETTSELLKMVRTWCVLCILTWTKGFAPQQRALLRHLNFQKWSEASVFCTFSLRNVLRATTACTFATSQLPKVVRSWCALYIFTSKCASRHNGVHFFDISSAKSGPHLVCFVHFDLEMCFAPQRRANFSSLLWPAGSAPAALASLLFDPPEPQIIEKHSESRLSYLFAHLHLLSSYSFSSTLLSSHLSLLSASALLCFSSVHIVGSLTSKLPSTKLAQNTFQYYFVLQSLRKTLPSTTLYCKACTKHFPVLLCTTKLAQTTSQYYCDQATVTQPLQCDLQRLSCKTQ